MKKPYTATTVLIERLTSEEYEENDYGGLPELIESIKLQDSGPTEASRAIRKKLKYGNVHRQLRALTLLDALISNAGPRFQRTFADEPLMERLRLAATDSTTDPDVRAKVKVLFLQWAREYQDAPGLQGVANLHKQFPRKPRPQPARPINTVSKPPPSSSPPPSSRSPPPVSNSPSSFVAPWGPPPDNSGGGGGGGGGWRGSHKKSTPKNKNRHQPTFNLEKEKPALNQALANASMASTNLKNALKLVNREKERPSQKREVVAHLEQCKSLHSSILRYIQLVESEQWLGSLINAHEELTTAVDMYEVYDKPIEEDSDSDDDWDTPDADDGGAPSRRMGEPTVSHDSPPPVMPSRPKGKMAVQLHDEEEDEEDPDDPFGNQYEVQEEDGVRWKVV